MAEGEDISQRGTTRRANWGFRLTIGLGAAAALAGCQTLVPAGPPEPTQQRPPIARPTPVRPTPVQPGIPQDTARNRIALLVPLTGPNAGVGQSIANATQLALLDTKTERLRVTTYDTNQGAALAAQKALADGSQLILGPLLSEDVRLVSPVAARAGVPVIAFSNDVSVAGNGTYILGFTPQQSIDRVVGYAKGQGIGSFAGLVPAGLYGQRASTSFLRAVEEAGGQVVSLQTYDRSNQSISAAVTKMAKSSPYQAVLIADSASTAAAAVPLLRRSTGADAHVLGTELWNTETSALSAPALNGAWFASVPDNLYRQFATKYRSRFGRAPYRLASLGYDAVLLTVRINQDWRIGTAFPEAKLRDRDGFAGIDGAFRFGRDGVAERSLEVQEIRNGVAVVVSPAPGGFGGR